jgi:DNA mismatch repair protein MSH6
LKLDKQLVSLGQVFEYDPIRQAGTLILDGQTLENLEIFQNSYDGTDKGTLFSLLNRCVTAFGKRLFRQWVCHPLRSADAINKRLDAVDDFNSILGVMEEISESLKRLPDLERLLSRIHAESCKLKDFLAVLDGFELLMVSLVCSHNFDQVLIS